MKRTTLAAVALAALVALTACSGDSETAAHESASGGDAAPAAPENPPTSLDAASFGEPVTVATGTAHDTDVAIDKGSGRIYVSWAQDLPPKEGSNFTPQDMYVAMSDDGGQSFSEPVRVNEVEGTVNAGFNTSTKVMVTGDNKLLATYPLMNSDMSAMNAMATLSTDGGQTFPPEKQVAAADGERLQMYHAIAREGKNVWIAYLDDTTDPTSVRMVKSEDEGATFGESTPAEFRTCECCDNALAVNSSGTMFLGFRISSTSPRTCRSATPRSPKLRRRRRVVRRRARRQRQLELQRLPGIWARAGGRLGRSAARGLLDGEAGRPGVYYTWSDDEGATFADSLTIATADFYPPSNMDVAVEDDGTVWFVWDDRRTKDRQVHLARAQDGAVEALAEPFGPGITPAIDSDGSLLALAWTDDEGVHVSTRGELAKESGLQEGSRGQAPRDPGPDPARGVPGARLRRGRTALADGGRVARKRRCSRRRPLRERRRYARGAAGDRDPRQQVGDVVRPCVREMPALEVLYQRYRGQGFEIIGVAIDRPGSEGSVAESHPSVASPTQSGSTRKTTSHRRSARRASRSRS